MLEDLFMCVYSEEEEVDWVTWSRRTKSVVVFASICEPGGIQSQ